MKNHSKIYRRFLVAISFTLLYFSIGAQAIASIDPGTLDNELNTPAVTSKQAGVLTSVMARYEQELIDQGLAVEMLRDDQVLDITIDLDYIFGPNSISILPTASEFLNPIIDFTRQFGKFKILMAVHSDNTGSEKYKEWLCEQRVIALYDFFDTFTLLRPWFMAIQWPIGNL